MSEGKSLIFELNVLQGDIDKSDSSVKVGCVRVDEQPAKKLCVDADEQPTKSLHVQSVDVDDSDTATGGEKLSFFVDLTASYDSELLPQSVPSDGRLSNSKDLLTSPPKAQDLCRTEDNNCACVHPQQLFSDSCTVLPPESPTLQANVGHDLHQQGVNGVCDVSTLKMPYRNATTGCHSCVTDELMDDRDDVIQANGFASLEPQVAGVVVNGGNIAHDCSCST